MTNKLIDLLTIIGNLKIPSPDTSREKIIKEENNIIPSRYIGILYDNILTQKLTSINFNKDFSISNNSIIYRLAHNKYTNFEINYENIYNIVHNKYNSNIYIEKLDNEIIINTSKYLLQLFNHTDFKNFHAKELIILNAKLDYPGPINIDNFGRKRGGTRVEPDIIIDDLIIDIKTYDKVRFSNTEFIQLFLYYIWFNHIFEHKNESFFNNPRFIKYNKSFNIKRLGIYFSKHNYLWTFAISDLCSKNELDILTDFCILNIKSNNFDFRKELESLFTLLQREKSSYRSNNKVSISLNEIQNIKVKQINELMSLRKQKNGKEINKEISNLIIQINKEYCYPYYDIRYRLSHIFDSKPPTITKFDKNDFPYDERIIEYDNHLVGFTKFEAQQYEEIHYLKKSIEDFIFYINYSNRLIERIEILENHKLNKCKDLIKSELYLVKKYYNEMLTL